MDKTQAAIAVFDKNAQRYQEQFMDTGLYQDSFDLFCDHIKKSEATILDVACGPGNITQYLLLKRPDWHITGIDLAPNMLALAGVNNPAAIFHLLDARAIRSLNRQWDGIMCGFCLPYLSREEAVQFINDAADTLYQHGVLYLSTMEDDYSRSGLQTSGSGEQLYMYYHEEGYLREALKQHNMNIIHTCRLCYPDKNGKEITDRVIIAVKQ